MARRAQRRSRNNNTIEVDFTGVDIEGGGAPLIPEGDYLVEVESVEQKDSKNDNPMLEWVFVGKEGKSKGKKFYYYTVLTRESLFNLGQLLDRLGFEVPDDVMEIDLTELPGSEITAVIGTETYQGKERSKIQDFYPVEDNEKEEPEPRGRRARGGKDKDEDNEGSSRRGRNGASRRSRETKVSADEVRDMKEDELEELLEKHDLDVDLKEYKTPRRKVAAVISALEDAKLLEAE